MKQTSIGKSKRKTSSTRKMRIGYQLYQHLLEGVNHMLPFIIGGGILMALAFLFDNYQLNPANYGSNTPFAAFLKTVGDTAFNFMLPVFSGFIARSIAKTPGLVVGFVGGALANSGGSAFLGALLAGYIAGYMMLLLERAFSRFPASLIGIKTSLIYPVIGVLGIGAIVIFLINPPGAALNAWIAQQLSGMTGGSKVVWGALLGALMAIDMGGPLNKATYLFATAALANGQYDIMAAVMIGGMIPPLALALCSTFFRNRFTRAQRQSAPTNYIMGLAVITEGALPYAAADPLRVIPACAMGAATAGSLCMALGCTLRAPHGGIFVLPVIGNPLGFVTALLAGAIVGMGLLAILKKPIQEQNNERALTMEALKE